MAEDTLYTPSTESEVANKMKEEGSLAASYLQQAAKKNKAKQGGGIGSIIGTIGGAIAAVYTGNPTLVLTGKKLGETIGSGIATKDFDGATSDTGGFDKLKEALQTKKKTPDFSSMSHEDILQHLQDNPDVENSDAFKSFLDSDAGASFSESVSGL
jgi:hypothetical protein